MQAAECLVLAGAGLSLTSDHLLLVMHGSNLSLFDQNGRRAAADLGKTGCGYIANTRTLDRTPTLGDSAEDLMAERTSAICKNA